MRYFKVGYDVYSTSVRGIRPNVNRKHDRLKWYGGQWLVEEEHKSGWKATGEVAQPIECRVEVKHIDLMSASPRIDNSIRS